MKIIDAAFSHRKAILLLTAILFLAGIYSAFQLPSGIYPEVNFPRIIIVAEAGDLPVGNMLLGVTRPLEESVSGVLGLYRIRSRTIRGESEISLLFLPRADMELGLQQVQAKISEVRSALPADTQLQVERVTPAIFPVLIYILTGRGTAAPDLRDYAQFTVKPTLSRIRGVGQVSVLGDTVREIEVVVDPQKLMEQHITMQQVEDAISSANTIEAIGRLNKDYKQFLLLVNTQIKNLEAIAGIPIPASADHPGAVVHIGDVARVFEGSQDRLMIITGNGEPAAQVNISRQIGGNLLNIEQEAQRAVNTLKGKLPPQVSITNVYDLAEFVRDSISSVRDAILIGCFLSVAILFFFLRRIRATLIAACSIPVTLVITLFFMKQLNETLNLMSLGGMAVAIGLVIDDAIVVVENIHRHLQQSLDTGESKETAVRTATNEIMGAVSGSTFTTVVVFLPLSLVEGVVGQFFAAFSITLSVAVLLSLILAFTFIPLMAERYLKEEKTESGIHDRLMHRVAGLYDHSIRKALAHPFLVIAATIVFVGLGALVYTQLESGFLPLMDEGSFVVDYWMPSGTSLEETNRVLHQVEEILKQTPEIAAISRRTGAELGLFATEQSTGDILVRLKKKRDRGAEEIMDELREKIETSQPAIRVEFIQILQDLLGDLEGAPEPVEVKIFGDDENVLQDRAVQIADQIEKIPGVVDLFNGVQAGNPEILVEVDPIRAQQAGLDPQSVAKQTADALLGRVVTEYRHFDRLIGIRVRFSDEQRMNYDVIRQFPLVNETTGAITPLGSIASFQEINGQNELLRENQRQMIAITARITGASLGNVIPKIKKILDAAPLPLGYTYEIGGQYQSQQQSFQQLLLVLFIAIMLVFILLVLQFRDFLAALVILSAAPVSLVGALLMLWITGTEFNVSSFMGLIMLVGLIVKNGIILIEYTFYVRDNEKIPLQEALVRAGKVRLRPILMTTLATLFGLLPLALGLGAGSEMQKPLALAVIGGLSLSMLVTLVFVPVMLLKLER